jgi:hypothetical protein
VGAADAQFSRIPVRERPQPAVRLASLVAYHSGARFEAEERGLVKELAEFEPDDPVHRAVSRSHPVLREAVDRTRERLTAVADQPM